MLFGFLFSTNIQAQYTIGTPDSATGTINDDDTATFTITGATVAENAGTAMVTINVDNPIDITTTINVAFADGTAGSADFTAATPTVTFNAGSTTAQTAMVTITNDNLVEATENITVVLSVLTDVGTRSIDVSDVGMVTVTDDDTATFMINDVTVSEVDGTADFTISVDNAIDVTTTVDVELADITAVSGTDYTGTTMTVTFNSGSTTSQTASVSIADDSVVEEDEYFNASLSATPMAMTARSVDDTDEATGTIQDNDAAIFTINNVTAGEASGTASFEISLDNPIDVTVQIDLAYVDGTAIGSGTDYTGTTMNVSFPAGMTATQSASFSINDDSIVEAAEDFTANITTATSLGSRNVTAMDSGTGTIEDNDTATFTIDDVTVGEASGTANFSVSLDNPIDVATKVNVSFAGGTATGGGTDYTSTTIDVDFPAGTTTTQTAAVPITIDNIVEADETFGASLAIDGSTPVGARDVNTIDVGTGTITDDDTATFTIDNVTIDEASITANFTVSLDNQIDIPVMVDVDFAGGTATGNNPVGTDDYNNMTQTVTFNANSTTSQTASVPVNDDATPEGDEDFTASLSINGGTMLDGRDVDVSDMGTGTILDNDCPCDPDCAVFPTAADIGSVLTAVEMNTIGDYTHYCAAGSKLLLSIKLDGATIPASAVTLKVTSTPAFFARYCGGGFFGGCFVKNVDGAAIYDKQWDVDYGATSGVSFPIRVVNYFTMQDITDLGAVEPMGYTPPTNTFSAVNLWKVNNATLPQYPAPNTIKVNHQTTVQYTTGSLSLLNWTQAPFTVGNGFGAEFEIANFTKGAGFGGKIK